MSDSLILLAFEAGVLTLTINRPKALNALNSAIIQQLGEAVNAAQHRDDVRVIVLTGAGDKAFVAGADIKEFADFDAAEGRRLAAEGQRHLFNRIAASRKPVIAAINGFALGGGLELAMCAHMRIAAETARMGLPEVSLGVIPGYGGTQRLPQLVGKGKAFEMITTARMIKAPEAEACGLVNAVVPAEDLQVAVAKLASKIMANAPTAVANALEAIEAGYAHDVDGFATEIARFGDCFATDDFREGTTAFLEKRKAQFPGK